MIDYITIEDLRDIERDIQTLARNIKNSQQFKVNVPFHLDGDTIRQEPVSMSLVEYVQEWHSLSSLFQSHDDPYFRFGSSYINAHHASQGELMKAIDLLLTKISEFKQILRAQKTFTAISAKKRRKK